MTIFEVRAFSESFVSAETTRAFRSGLDLRGSMGVGGFDAYGTYGG